MSEIKPNFFVMEPNTEYVIHSRTRSFIEGRGEDAKEVMKVGYALIPQKGGPEHFFSIDETLILTGDGTGSTLSLHDTVRNALDRSPDEHLVLTLQNMRAGSEVASQSIDDAKKALDANTTWRNGDPITEEDRRIANTILDKQPLPRKEGEYIDDLLANQQVIPPRSRPKIGNLSGAKLALADEKRMDLAPKEECEKERDKHFKEIMDRSLGVRNEKSEGGYSYLTPTDVGVAHNAHLPNNHAGISAAKYAQWQMG